MKRLWAFIVLMGIIISILSAVPVFAKTTWNTPIKTQKTSVTDIYKRKRISKKAKKTKTYKKVKKLKNKKKTKVYSTKKVVTIIKRTITTWTHYKKGSKIKKIHTRIRKTTVKYVYTKNGVVMSKASEEETSTTSDSYDMQIRTAAPLTDAPLLNAFEELGFTLTIDESFKYSGYFTSKEKQIILKKADNTIYHELGHLLSFVAGISGSDDAKEAYASEKGLYTGINKVYVTSTKDEYLAEAYRDYILDKSSLATERPKTYAVVQRELSRLTSERLRVVKLFYDE